MDRNVRRAAGIAAAAVIGLSLVAGIAARADAAARARILPGVTVAGVDVGGMSRDEALAAVDAVAKAEPASPITIRVATARWTVIPQVLGVAPGVDRAVDAEIGRAHV